ncbi:MAG: hypothetical protein ABS949_10730 [Solibacillus sp.]
MNDYQLTLYELMISLPLKDELKDALYAAILSTPITTIQEFTITRDTLMRILLDIEAGTLTVRSTVRAVFKGAYEKARARPKIDKPVVTKHARPVPFYDWLTIRA